MHAAVQQDFWVQGLVTSNALKRPIKDWSIGEHCCRRCQPCYATVDARRYSRVWLTGGSGARGAGWLECPALQAPAAALGQRRPLVWSSPSKRRMPPSASLSVARFVGVLVQDETLVARWQAWRQEPCHLVPRVFPCRIRDASFNDSPALTRLVNQ